MYALIILALIDSLSIGTLVIPLVLLLQPRVRWSMFGAYCVMLGLFYFVLGILLLLGLSALLGPLTTAIDSPAGLWVQLIVGGALLIWALFYDLPIVQRLLGKKNNTDTSMINRWEARLSGKVGIVSVISIAVIAGLVESATMAPYLAAIGILVTSEISLPLQIITLLGYCIVMFTPIIVLAIIRRATGNRLDELFMKIKNRVVKEVAATTPWVIGIIGFYMASFASAGLFY